MALAEALDCWPPKLFGHPYTHLIDELKTVSDFPKADSENSDNIDILEGLREELIKQASNRVAITAESLALKGDWEGVIATIDPKTKKDSEKELLSWAYFSQAGNLKIKGELESDENLLQQSLDKYTAAFEIKPDDLETLNDWGNALTSLAKLKSDEDMFRKGFEKYATALEIDPRDSLILYNWGVALSDLAKLKSDKSLYLQGCEKYAAAFEANPDEYRNLENWGANLIFLYHITSKEHYLNQAKDILLKLQQLDSDMLYNLACCYALLGETDNCRTALEHCKKMGTLPKKEDVTMADTDFASVKDYNWFKALFDEE